MAGGRPGHEANIHKLTNSLGVVAEINSEDDYGNLGLPNRLSIIPEDFTVTNQLTINWTSVGDTGQIGLFVNSIIPTNDNLGTEISIGDLTEDVSFKLSEKGFKAESNKCYLTTDADWGDTPYYIELPLDLSTFPSTIQITCSTPEANIYYTTDGNNPTSSSTLYSNTFTAEAGITVKAIAIKEGMVDSDITQVTV